MKKFIKYGCIVVLLVSCNKFEHADLPKNDCSLCSYAQELEGDYRGYNYSVNSTYHDSVTAHVEQIFLGNNQFEDSTVMHFRLTVVFDNTVGSSSQQTFIDTIRIINTTGATMDYNSHELISIGAFIEYINPAQLKLHKTYSIDNSSVLWYLATMYHQ